MDAHPFSARRAAGAVATRVRVLGLILGLFLLL
jgi:hypothetical protein